MRTACRCTRSRPSGCCSRRAGWCSTDGAYRPVGDLDDLAVPETLTALIAARLDGLDPADRELVADAAVLGQSFSLPGLAAISGVPESALEPRLRILVRRELFVHRRRSPVARARPVRLRPGAHPRGRLQHALAKRDRKVRHLAAARYFENLGTDELAGGLAGHYLAAQRLAADPAEADALAAQARVALRGAAERATALGSHEQALAFLEQALEITTDPADRAALHTSALASARMGLDAAVVLRHAEGAVAERRRTGDREAIAIAIADLARAHRGELSDPARGLAIAMEAWSEFSDLEQTPAGVALMGAMASGHRGLVNNEDALAWADRLLPIAERLGLLDDTIRGLIGRGTTLLTVGRPREGMIVMRGVHQLTIAQDIRDLELNARVLMTFFEQWGEPAAGLALGREGLEIGRRLGSRAYGFQMVGNASICAFRVGEWDWAAALIDEWLAHGRRPLRPPGSSSWTARSCARCAARTRHRTSRRPTGCSGPEPSRTPSASRTCSWRAPGLPSPPAGMTTCARSARRPSSSPATSRRSRIPC